MVLVLLQLLLTLFSTVVTGLALHRLVFRVPAPQQLSLASHALLGLLFHLTLGNVLSLFMGLGPVAPWLAFAAPALLLPLVGRDLRPLLWKPGQPPLQVAMAAAYFLGFLLMIVVKGAERTEIGDEGFYHVPNIKAIVEYGVITGIGNFYGHFGINSIWHVGQAWFSLAPLTGVPSVMELNGFIYLLTLTEAVNTGFGRHDLGRHHNWIRLLALVLPLLFMRNIITSVSTDAGTIPLSHLAAVLVVRHLGQGNLWKVAPVVLLAALAVPMSKVSHFSMALLALPLAIICLQHKAQLRAWPVVALALALGLSFLARNYIMTGYMLFPIATTLGLHPDWQMAKQVVKDINIPAHYGVAEFPPRFSGDFIAFWWNRYPMVDRLMLVLLFVYMAASPFLFARVLRLNDKTERLVYASMMLLAWVGMAGWWFSTPEMRYGFGFIGIAALVLPCWLGMQLLGRLKEIWPYVYGLFALAAVVKGVATLTASDQLPAVAVAPEPYPAVTCTQQSFNGYVVNVVQNNTPVWFDYKKDIPEVHRLFWQAPIPRVRFPVQAERVVMRGTTIRDGYRLKEPAVQE